MPPRLLLLLFVALLQLSNTMASSRSLRSVLAGMPRFPLPPSSQLRLQVPACTFDTITETCEQTNNLLLKEGSASRLKGATFDAKALAFKVAATAYCGQFPRRNCSYPCQDNGEICGLAGVVSYGIYACPGSEAEQDAFCTAAPMIDPNLCAATPECRPGATPSACAAKFKANFTQQQRMQYLSDWGTTRKNVWGCCLGSTAKFRSGPFCDQYSSDEAGCSEQAGCSFLADGTCALNTTQWMDNNFPHKPLLEGLKQDVQECSQLSGAAACLGHRTYTTNPVYMTNILQYMFSLAKHNDAVPESTCIVWSSP